MSFFMARDVRTAIGNAAERCKNPALFASKFPDLAKDEADKESKKRTLERLIKLPSDEQGRKARLTFFEALRVCGFPCATFTADLRGRLIVNQAGGVLENAGLCLDRHFGIPYIPGSALKGIARAAARDIAEEPKEIFAVFGWSAGDSRVPEEARKTGFAGSTSFLPAFPVRDAPLNIDIVTCHHSEYYRESLQAKALDTEAPIPNPFPVVEAGTEFCFALLITLSPSRLNELKKSLDLSSDFDPLPRARDWLLHGLTELGIGAKTSAGYGWFRYDEEAQKKQVEAGLARERAEEEERQHQAREGQRREEERKRLEAMSPVERARERLLKMGDQEFAAFARALAEKLPDEQKAFLQTMRLEKKDRWKTWKKKKQDLAQIIGAVAKRLGEDLP